MEKGVSIRIGTSGWKLYASQYPEEELRTWAEKIDAWERDAFIYFDNDFEGHAVNNAMRLKEILGVD